MNPAWREFLSEHGALDAVHGRPGAGSAARSLSTIADLSHLGVIEITGADATAFLHGQFTSDVAGLPVNHAQFSAWCNAKGQVIAVVLLLRMPGRCCIFLPQEQSAGLAKRLGMYVLRADVRISDRSDEWVRFGVVEDPGSTPAPDATASVPAPWHVSERRNMVQLRLPDAVNCRRLLFCGDLAAAQSLWRQLATGHAAVSPRAWELQDILIGIPWLIPALAEKFLPQELALEPLGALSLSKGCYPGQEIIARAHYRGRVKRGLYRFTVKAPEPPVPAATFSAGSSEQHPAGTVLRAQTRDGDSQTGLAVCDLELAATAALHLASPRGPRVVLDKLVK